MVEGGLLGGVGVWVGGGGGRGGGGDLETTLKNRPNLLIKGNNLIALHSFKEYFRHQSEQTKSN